MEISIVQHGAAPSLPDNALAIQAALNAAQPGDTIVIPLGTFDVQGEQLQGRSGVNIRFDGWLKAIPSARQMDRLLRLEEVSDVQISGSGGLIGQRDAPMGTGAPEDMQAHNLAIYGSSRILVTGITSQNARGDNFYLQNVVSTTIQDTIGRNAMRNNLSIVGAKAVNVMDNTFETANGPEPMPQAGIDLEPDVPQQQMTDIVITRNRFIKNKGPGVFVAMGNTSNVHNVHVFNNDYDQHYKDGSGAPTSGINTWQCNLGYAVLRWFPGYDYWFWPKEYAV